MESLADIEAKARVFARLERVKLGLLGRSDARDLVGWRKQGNAEKGHRSSKAAMAGV